MQPIHGQRLTNERQRVVLVNIFLDRDRLAGLPCGSDCGLPRLALGGRRIAVQNAKAGIVPLDVHRWLGRPPTPSEQVLFHREYLKLEGMGLVRRINLRGGRRTTHLRLTALGERVAERLLAEEVGDRNETVCPPVGNPPGPAARPVDESADVPAPISLDEIDWSVLVIPDDAETADADDAAQQPA